MLNSATGIEVVSAAALGSCQLSVAAEFVGECEEGDGRGETSLSFFVQQNGRVVFFGDRNS